jgi:hypothetical protein
MFTLDEVLENALETIGTTETISFDKVSTKTSILDSRSTVPCNYNFTFILVEKESSIGDVSRFSIGKKEIGDTGDTLQGFSILMPVLENIQEAAVIEATLKIGDNLWKIVNESIVKISDGKIVAHSDVFVKDGKEASTRMVSKEPYKSVKVAGNTEQIVIEFIDVGITVTVKPQRVGDFINTDLSAEVSEVLREADEHREITIPVTSSRDIRTNIDLIPGRLEVLSELTIDKKVTTKKGIPFLRNIPIIGTLVFTVHTEGVVSTKLYIVGGIIDKQDGIRRFEEFRDDRSEEIKERTPFK